MRRRSWPAKADVYTPHELHAVGHGAGRAAGSGRRPARRPAPGPGQRAVPDPAPGRRREAEGPVRRRRDVRRDRRGDRRPRHAAHRATTTAAPAERQAEALADVCGYVLDHAPSSVLPDAGGHRPHVNVLIRLEDLENRARAGCLDFGGPVTPESLRMLCCDAAVVPIVLNGTGPAPRRRPGHPHHPGRAAPGGGRPGPRMRAPRLRPSGVLVRSVTTLCRGSCGGETKLSNLVMLCRVHHRQIHSTEWVVRIRDGLPEFIPPAVDRSRATTPPTSPAAPRRGAMSAPLGTLGTLGTLGVRTSPSRAACCTRGSTRTRTRTGRAGPGRGRGPAPRGPRVSRRPCDGPGRPGDGSPQCHRTARRCRSRAPWPADRPSHRCSAAAARPPRPGRPRRS